MSTDTQPLDLEAARAELASINEHTGDGPVAIDLIERLIAEVERLRAALAGRNDDVRHTCTYSDVYHRANVALGNILGPLTGEGGDGLVEDIALLAEQRDEARTELAKLRGGN